MVAPLAPLSNVADNGFNFNMSDYFVATSKLHVQFDLGRTRRCPLLSPRHCFIAVRAGLLSRWTGARRVMILSCSGGGRLGKVPDWL